jgi:hypothetical protein
MLSQKHFQPTMPITNTVTIDNATEAFNINIDPWTIIWFFFLSYTNEERLNPMNRVDVWTKKFKKLTNVSVQSMHLTNAAPRTAAQAQTHVRSYNNNSNEKKLQQFN